MTHPSADPLCAIIIFWRDERRPHKVLPDIPERAGDGRAHALDLFWDTVAVHARDARRISLYQQGVNSKRLALWTTGMPTIQPRDEQLIEQVREQVCQCAARFVRRQDSRGTSA